MKPARSIPRALQPRVWWWVAAALVLHAVAWTAWLEIASRHPVADVPLATAPGP
jgi:hypothetical protein